MIVLNILLSLLVLLAALLLLPVRLSLRLVDEKLTVSVKALGIRYKLYPRSVRKKPARTKKKKAQAPAQESGKGNAATEIFDLLRVVLPRVPKLFGAIDVPKFYFRLRIVADDPAKCAEWFGAACAAIGMVWNHLERIFSFRRPRIDIEPDFDGERTELLLFADIRSCALKLLVAALPVLVSYLKRKIQLSGGKTK